MAVEQRIQVSMRLRRKGAERALERFVAALAGQKPRHRKYLTRQDFAGRFGAKGADIALVEAFAHRHGLTVTRIDQGARTIRLEGDASLFNKAFGIRLGKAQVRGRGRRYRSHGGATRVPRELRGAVVAVHGLDCRPVARPQYRMRRTQTGAGLTATQVARAYSFPQQLDGSGQCIALIELNDTSGSGAATGAGYKVSDLAAYFKKLGIKVPAVTAVSVDGGANLPGKSDADGEVVLDIEVAGAVAPGASIAVYFAPNTDAGFVDAINAAVHDDVRKPSVVSISWGGPEDPSGQLDKSFLTSLEQAVLEAAAMGVSVCVAAGDDGSADMSSGWDGKPHADFPASSPYALACGGTSLRLSGTKIVSESVWNDGTRGGAGGGGVSNFFALPGYQKNASVPLSPTRFKGRGLPDVAGNADPQTGYRVFLNGKWTVIGGTSAVAPLMAGLLACINQQLASTQHTLAGPIHTQLYGASTGGVTRDITAGNNDVTGTLNGLYTAKAGWDGCSGLGVVQGTALLKLLSQ